VKHKFVAVCTHSISLASHSAVASYSLVYRLAYSTMPATSTSSMCQCDTPLPAVLLLVSPNSQQWVLEGPARRYHKVMLTVHVTDSVSTVSTIAAGYQRQGKHFQAVCLASRHGAETQAQLKWKEGGHLTLTQTSIKAVSKITKRVHIITCWQGLFLQSISVPGVVLSAYNTWMSSYGKDESGNLIEPEPWQLHYIGCGLPLDNSLEHKDAHGQSCTGLCRAEPGALVVKATDSTLLTL
jgi:hypothetical protein